MHVTLNLPIRTVWLGYMAHIGHHMRQRREHSTRFQPFLSRFWVFTRVRLDISEDFTQHADNTAY